MGTDDRHPHTTTSISEQFGQFNRSKPEPQKPEPQKASILVALLRRLSAHCPLQNVTPEQTTTRLLEMADDLATFSIADVEAAIRAYRQDPKAKFFPTSGRLIELAGQARKERDEAQRGPARAEFGESRPIMWWMISRKLWAPRWREEEIPEEWRAAYFARKAKGFG